MHYTRGEIAGALGVMVVIGLVTGYLWRDELRAFVRERWRFILLAEAIFLFAFLLSYWIRLQNPDLWHPTTAARSRWISPTSTVSRRPRT